MSADPSVTPLVPAEVVQRYVAAGWWGTTTLGDLVRGHATDRPDAPAFIAGDRVTSWAGYDALADRLAAVLVGSGRAPGERVGVLLPDGAVVHATFLATERAGLVAVGIGARAGDAELVHLLRRTGCRTVVTPAALRGRSLRDRLAGLRDQLPDLEHHLVVDEDGAAELVDLATGAATPADALVAAVDPAAVRARALGPDDLFLLNSTSGTTGLPKCVTQFQNRWFYFHQLAARAAHLTAEDVFLSAVPAPFGFGLWTAHVTPTVLGAPTVLLPSFSADGALDAIARHRVTVLACVSTQFIMMLNAGARPGDATSTLRVMFTGGEAVPYERGAEFEDRFGAHLLQFFGSNESGAFSCTTVDDSRDQRLRTAGRIIPEMAIRLFDPADGSELIREPGQPAGRGPATCAGYYDDPAANAQLYTDDGWMLMGDIVTIDDDGYLTVVGRTSDIVIRGGKNISSAQVEEQVGALPGVAMVAVVPVPDPVYGERVCAAVVAEPGHDITLASLCDQLVAKGCTKETLPEHLVLLDELPRSSGGKVAKGDLRAVVEASLAGGRVGALRG